LDRPTAEQRTRPAQQARAWGAGEFSTRSSKFYHRCTKSVIFVVSLLAGAYALAEVQLQRLEPQILEGD
jgi:hypothetical protein